MVGKSGTHVQHLPMFQSCQSASGGQNVVEVEQSSSSSKFFGRGLWFCWLSLSISHALTQYCTPADQHSLPDDRRNEMHHKGITSLQAVFVDCSFPMRMILPRTKHAVVVVVNNTLSDSQIVHSKSVGTTWAGVNVPGPPVSQAPKLRRFAGYLGTHSKYLTARSTDSTTSSRIFTHKSQRRRGKREEKD